MKPAYYGWIFCVLLAGVLGLQTCARGRADAKAIAQADTARIRSEEAKRAVAAADSLLRLQPAIDSQLGHLKATGSAWQTESQRLAAVVAALRAGVATPLPVISTKDTCAPWALRVQALGILLDSVSAQSVADTNRAHAAEQRATLAEASRSQMIAGVRFLRDTLDAAQQQLAKWPKPPKVKNFGILADARISTDDASAFVGATWKALALGARGRVAGSVVTLAPEARATFSLRLF